MSNSLHPYRSYIILRNRNATFGLATSMFTPILCWLLRSQPPLWVYSPLSAPCASVLSRILVCCFVLMTRVHRSLVVHNTTDTFNSVLVLLFWFVPPLLFFLGVRLLGYNSNDSSFNMYWIMVCWLLPWSLFCFWLWIIECLSCRLHITVATW